MKIFMNIRAKSSRLPDKTFIDLNKTGIELYKRSLLKFNDYEIYVDTDSDEIIEQCNKDSSLQHVTAYKRAVNHINNKNPGVSMIRRFVHNYVHNDDPFFIIHITSPFLKKETLQKALELYDSRYEIDSVCSVTKHQEFMFRPTFCKEDGLIRYVPVNFPSNTCFRTQDLESVYSLNHAFYLINKKDFLKYNSKIGQTPYFLELEYPENIDLDTEEDLLMAQNYMQSESYSDHIC